MTNRRRGLLAAGAVFVATAFALAGCASNSGSLSGTSSSSTKASAGASESIVVGSANFPENEIISDIYGQALAANGFTVTYKPEIGARAAYIAALNQGSVNLIPEYAGSILSYLDGTANAKSGAAVKTALDAELTKGSKFLTAGKVEALDFSQAADSDSLNVTPAYAKAHSLTSIADLSKVGKFTLAANPEFSSRPDGIKGLQSVYSLKNISFKAINDSGGPATLKALLNNTVQVADIYSTTPSILANKLVTLTDPNSLFASQQVVPIVSKDKVNSKLTSVLNKVSAALTTTDLLSLNTKNQGADKTAPDVLAKQWLAEKNLF
jgi:osmoprotectant transport system substrate-binding protein